jgi:3',5'-cyclic AMP phosphodiesterase CpdA
MLTLAWFLAACRPPTPAAAPPPDFHFAVVGDRTDEANDEAWRAVLAEIEGLHPDLVVTVGDLADDALDDGDWERALAPTRALTSPIAFTPGNHDIVDEATAAVFARHTGQAPHRSFDVRGAHFVVVDNSVAESWEELPEAQRVWLEEDLLAHAGQMQLVFMHKPFWALRAARGEPDPMHDLFARAGVRAVFTGHWHSHGHQVIDGVEYVLVGSSGGATGGVQDVRRGNAYEYVWGTVRGGALDLRTIALGSVHPIDGVSLADNQRLRALFRGGITATLAADGRSLSVRIRNDADQPLVTQVTVEPGTSWRADPPVLPVAVSPGETFEGRVALTGGDPLLPLPRVVVPVPLPDAGPIPYVAVADHPREVTVPRGPAPAIDGVVQAEEWAGAVEITSFTTARGEVPGADPTRLLLRYDDDALYVGAILDDSRPADLSRIHHGRDGHVVYDDRIGLLLAPAPDQVFWFYVNPNGAVWDLHADRAAGEVHRDWDAVEAAATVSATGWSAEARVPFSALGAAPGDGWRFDVRRRQESTQTEAVFTPAFFMADPARIGVLRFGGE